MSRLPRDERGFSTPLMLLILAMMVMLMGGISIDLWRVIAEHREVAGVVDGAAVAGATAVDVGAFALDPTASLVLDRPLAVQRACRYLWDNANIARCPGGEVSVNVSDDTVTVSLTSDVPLTLLSAVDFLNAPIKVYSEASVVLQRGVAGR